MRRGRMTLAAGAAVLAIVGAPSTSVASASMPRLSAQTARELSSIYRTAGAADRPALRRRASGHPHARAAIVGGTPAQRGDLGYAAFVVDFDADGNPQFACSGTVLSPNVVLTAAHCAVDETLLDPLPADGFRVVTGAVDWTDEADRHISHVSQVIPNPGYDDISDVADAALLVLREPTTAPAIRLAANGERYLYTPGMPAVIAGWGIDDTGTASTVLHWADTTVQGPGYCSQFIDFFDGFWQTCTVQAPGFSAGVCSGDSGGPLLVLDANDRPVQIGVIDLGAKDCNTARPGYSARANPLLSWASSVAASVAAAGSRPMAAAPDRPVPPTLTEAGARSHAAAMVRRRAHARPRLSVSCGRLTPWKLHCDLRWRTRASFYTASGTFWHYLRGATALWSYDFKGRVTTRRCNAGGRCKTIGQRFRWR